MLTTAAQRQSFQENGYLIIPDLFSPEEIAALKADMAALNTERLVAEAQGRNKGGMIVEDGTTPRLQFEIHRTNTRFALLSRHPRVAGIMQELMERPLYIYHTKLAFKSAFTGSVQFWHQDYGYWINNGHPHPFMASCFVMLDEHTEDNGCMQVLDGSHLSGVVYHEPSPRESTGDAQIRISAADMAEYCTRYRRVKLIGKPGTFVAWHCNTMHASSHNISENSRHAAIIAFNAVGNCDPQRTVSRSSPYEDESETPVVLCADDSLLR